MEDPIKGTLDEAEWSWLAPHLARDGLILVPHELNLLAVAEKLARDDKIQVAEWIQRGMLTKPTTEQIEAWNRTPMKKFLTVIVQPYVLAQEHLIH